MYDNYKVVVNTAAGRRRCMQYLVPFVISSDIVDRYDIWINTHNGADIEFFRKLSKAYSKINLVWQPDGIVDGISSINAFYKKCIEEQTVYCKLDDDIIWMEEDSIEKMVKFRIDNPEYFVVSPLIINNSLSTYLLQKRKAKWCRTCWLPKKNLMYNLLNILNYEQQKRTIYLECYS